MTNPFDDAAAAFAGPEPKGASQEEAEETASGLPLETVDAPGDYDLREESYHADPCPEPSLSSTIAKVLANLTPLHAWTSHPRLNPEFERKESATFDMGSAFHKLILGKGKELEPLDFPGWRSKDAKAAREAAYLSGCIPLLKAQHDRALAMSRSVRAQISGWEELHLAMAYGSAERTLIWKEETPFGEIWCRAQIDWLPTKGELFPDWKSAQQSAGPEQWGGRTLWDQDGHIQAAFYQRGLMKALGWERSMFFAVAEISEPHALCCHRPVPSAVAMAMRDVERAIWLWGWCLKHNRWPGYRQQMAWVEPPPWKERSFLEREERGELDMGQTIELLEMSKERPEPIDVEGETDEFGLKPIPNLGAKE